ncbi:MAG TPA: lipoprotein [Rhodocyclaceae bacterium]|nr:lipoprotein [Rhodocyclaceae bacterium]
MRQLLTLTSIALLVVACGTRGPLTLPPGPRTPAILDRQTAPSTPTTTAKPAAAPDNSNKATEPKQ